MPAVDSVDNFVDSLLINHLLAPDQMNKVSNELLPRIRDSRALARELIQRGWLTVFQINQILQGQAKDLVLGPFRILDHLGEGGVAVVYKAWHVVRRCHVALKVVRKQFLANPDAVRQFAQESRTISSLSHPNIVRTLDADQVNGTHFLAMEFLEGIDLAKQIRLSSPMPISHSADYIRQASLGLQHAHERCLVHRDIKPANLYLVLPPGQPIEQTPASGDNWRSPPPLGTVIKILDWGLADMRLPMATGQQDPANTLQREETMGTADYLAPEQALDAARADIRADIYSLGCTLYCLLAGNPPFPGGSLMQKLLKHREAMPRPIQEIRQDIHPGLPPILERMLAKKPEDRYRTPAAVAAAIKPFCGSVSTGPSALPTIRVQRLPAKSPE